MIFTKILGASAIILGIYLLFVGLFSQKPLISSDSYHLGCFLVNSSLSQSFEIRQVLERIDHTAKVNTKLNQHYTNLSFADHQTNAMQLAKKFEKYLNAIIANQLQEKNQLEYFRAVNKASQKYENCKLKINLNETECLQNWEEYSKCSVKLDEIKTNLTLLFSEKKNINANIDDVLKRDFKSDFKKTQTNQIEQKYRQWREAIQQKEREVLKELDRLKQKNQTKSYQLETFTRQFSNLESSYKDCLEHRIQYRHCQQLSKDVQSLGYDSIDALETRIKQKQATLSKLRDMLDRSPKKSESIRQLFSKGINEYKALLKLFIEARAKINRHCGCTQERQKQLQKKFTLAKEQFNTKNQQIKNIQDSIKFQNLQLIGLKKKLEKLLSDYQAQILKITNTDIGNIDPDELLAKNRQKLQKINIQILDLKTNFDQLGFLCNQLKDSLMRRLPIIDEANSCLFEKEYYLGIKKAGDKDMGKKGESQTEKYLKGEIKEILTNYEL